MNLSALHSLSHQHSPTRLSVNINTSFGVLRCDFNVFSYLMLIVDLSY